MNDNHLQSLLKEIKALKDILEDERQNLKDCLKTIKKIESQLLSKTNITLWDKIKKIIKYK